MALGTYSLTNNGAAADLAITAPATIICTPVTSLIGMQAMSVWLQLAYGSGGTSVKAYLQTAFDSVTWLDIACVLFNAVSETRVLNFSGLTPVAQITPTDGAMAVDTLQDGILGTTARLKVVTLGIYAGNTLLKGRMIAR